MISVISGSQFLNPHNYEKVDVILIKVLSFPRRQTLVSWFTWAPSFRGHSTSSRIWLREEKTRKKAAVPKSLCPTCPFLSARAHPSSVLPWSKCPYDFTSITMQEVEDKKRIKHEMPRFASTLRWPWQWMVWTITPIWLEFTSWGASSSFSHLNKPMEIKGQPPLITILDLDLL